MDKSKKEFIIYISVAFAVAWLLQLTAIFILPNLYQLILALSMFAPLLAVVVTKRGIKNKKSGINWSIKFKSNLKSILVAWFSPLLFTILGAVLYFAVFPDKLDLNFGYITKVYESAGIDMQGMSAGVIVLVSVVQCVTYAPLVNALAAVGEEAGWRGYMTPALEEWFGTKKAMIVSGAIWGIWHMPLIVFSGYEYGTGYILAPISGVILFCFITIAIGIILTWLYKKSECIWVPSIFHGAFNAAATLPVCFTDGTMQNYFLGPVPVGLISGIPLFIAAIIIIVKMNKSQKPEN